jgi:hypothetical protein
VSDLDRTLIYSRDGLGLQPGAGVGLVCVEHYLGAPMSYLTVQAAGLLADLAEVAIFVPATTRTRAQFARITLPGPLPRYSIAANGGYLLDRGEPDREWSEYVARTLRATSAPLEVVWDHAGKIFSPAFTTSLRQAEGLFVYAVVERRAVPAGFVTELVAWAGDLGWSVSLQGRKLYLVPLSLTKSAAVAEVARRVGAGAVLAAGDSLLDLDMLEAADAAIRPGHGELHESGWLRDHVTVTQGKGVLAGEEILAWLLAGRRAGRWTPRHLPPAVG